MISCFKETQDLQILPTTLYLGQFHPPTKIIKKIFNRIPKLQTSQAKMSYIKVSNTFLSVCELKPLSLSLSLSLSLHGRRLCGIQSLSRSSSTKSTSESESTSFCFFVAFALAFKVLFPFPFPFLLFSSTSSSAILLMYSMLVKLSPYCRRTVFFSACFDLF